MRREDEKMLHTSINGHSHLTIFYNMCMYTNMYNTLFYILKCFMPYDFLPFFLYFTLEIEHKKWKISKKVFPIIKKFPFQVHRHFRYNKNTQIEYTTSKFTIQWTALFTHTHSNIHTYVKKYKYIH